MKTTLKKYLDLLENYPVRQVPRAAQFIVNQMAFEARQLAVKKVQERFITRNRYVTGRIQFQTATPSRNISEIKSKMGALDEIAFMAQQEEGFTIKPTKGSKVAVPTRAARVSKSIEKRKRTIYRTSKLGELRKNTRYSGKNNRQKTLNMLQAMAKSKDKKAAVIPFPNAPGIYVLRNIRKVRGRYRFRLHKLYDLSKRSVRIKPRPWMAPTMKKVATREAAIAERAWARYLSRL